MDDHDLLVKKSFLVVPMDYAAVILLLPVEDADGKVIIVAYTAILSLSFVEDVDSKALLLQRVSESI